MPARPLPFDPIAEARRQWELRWDGAVPMAAATSIMRAQQIILGQVDAALRPFGLTFARYECLTILYVSRRGSLPLGKMGQRLMVHPTSITNSIDRLEAEGLVERVAHPTDRRTTLAAITAKGRETVEKATAVLVDGGFAMGSLSEDELVQLTVLLRKLRAGVHDFAEDTPID